MLSGYLRQLSRDALERVATTPPEAWSDGAFYDTDDARNLVAIAAGTVWYPGGFGAISHYAYADHDALRLGGLGRRNVYDRYANLCARVGLARAVGMIQRAATALLSAPLLYSVKLGESPECILRTPAEVGDFVGSQCGDLELGDTVTIRRTHVPPGALRALPEWEP